MANAQPSTDVFALLRTRKYIVLLILSALLGVPISFAAYFFLALVSELQDWTFTRLPEALGLGAEPMLWPLAPLFVAGIVVALSIRYLPGGGGHSPADGLHAGGPPLPVELPGVFIAATASLALGAVIGPEAPLIALGGGLAALTVRAARKDPGEQAIAVVGACGSFAAVSALLGSPLVGAFLMMEVSGLGGPKATLVLMPGLLAAGIGFMVFVGLDSWTGLGTFSLSIPDLARFGAPTIAELGWALVIGAGAALLGAITYRGALFLRTHVERNLILVTPVVGLGVGALAILYTESTSHSYSDVLFSGQEALPSLVAGSESYSVEALLLLVACKGLAYTGSLSAFRGGAIFPSLFIGAAAGILLSRLGLDQTAAIAMGMGAMSVAMLRLPLTSALLASLLLASSGPDTIPLIVVAVVVSFVLTAWVAPAHKPEADTNPEPST